VVAAIVTSQARSWDEKNFSSMINNLYAAVRVGVIDGELLDLTKTRYFELGGQGSNAQVKRKRIQELACLCTSRQLQSIPFKRRILTHVLLESR
jgi:hypothetical protein